MTRRGQAMLLSGAAGALWGACWLPWLPAPLFPVAFAGLLAALRRVATGRQALAVGAVWAVTAYGVSGHFLFALTRYSPLAAAFFLVMVGYFLPFSMAATWGAFRLEHATGISRRTAFVLLYVVLEWTRTCTDLSFPADILAHAFGDAPSFLSLAPWVGPHGQTLWVLVVAVLLESAAARAATAPRRAAVPFAAALVLWIVPPAVAALGSRVDDADRPTIAVGLVQPTVPVTEKFDPSRHEALWGRLVDLSRRVAPQADLVVWPESTRPRAVRWDDEAPFRDPMMEGLARELETPVLYGCEIARYHGGEFVALYNGAALARPDGRPGDWYGKQRLLPFAEGVPFGDLLGWDPFADGGGKSGSGGVLTMLGKFRAGPRATLFDAAGARIGVLICYEGMYPRLPATYRREGATVLAVLTNDMWWGRSAFPRWHDLQAGTVARTYRVPVVRAANGGYSGAFSADGTDLGQTRLLDVTARLVRVEMANPPAPAAVTTRWLVPLLAALALVGGCVGARLRRRPAAPA